MARKRFVIEGIWSGYRSSQRKVVHRAVTHLPGRYEHLRTIRYTDGTTLDLTIRPVKPRERVQEIKGYTSLINEAAALDKAYVTVAELS